MEELNKPHTWTQLFKKNLKSTLKLEAGDLYVSLSRNYKLRFKKIMAISAQNTVILDKE